MANNDYPSRSVEPIDPTVPPSRYIPPPPLAPGVKIRHDAIQRPDFITLYFGFLGRTNFNRKVIWDTRLAVAKASVSVNRSLTQPEVDYFTEEAGRSRYLSRLGLMLGIQFGTAYHLMQYHKSREWAPFAPVTTKADPEWQRMLWAFTNMARKDKVMLRKFVVGHLRRVIAWSCLTWFATSIYTVTTGAAKTLGDHRVAEFVQEVKQQDPKDIEFRRRNSMYARAQMMKGRQLGQVDGDQDEPTEPSWNEISSADSAESAYSSPSSSGYYPSSTYTNNPPTQQQNSGSGFFDDNDASPIAPDYQDTAPQGSAWDRIRQQNQSQPSRSSQQRYSGAQPTQTGGQGASSGSAWDNIRSQGSEFSRAASQTESQRDAAQADFDRMLDAERARGNSSESGPQW